MSGFYGPSLPPDLDSGGKRGVYGPVPPTSTCTCRSRTVEGSKVISSSEEATPKHQDNRLVGPRIPDTYCNVRQEAPKLPQTPKASSHGQESVYGPVLPPDMSKDTSNPPERDVFGPMPRLEATAHTYTPPNLGEADVKGAIGSCREAGGE